MILYSQAEIQLKPNSPKPSSRGHRDLEASSAPVCRWVCAVTFGCWGKGQLLCDGEGLSEEDQYIGSFTTSPRILFTKMAQLGTESRVVLSNE